MKLDLPWEKDLSVNRYRFGRPGQSHQYHQARRPHVQAWHDAVVMMIRNARQRQYAAKTGRNLGWSHLPTPKTPMRIQIWYRWPEKRRRDPSNFHKVLLDAMQEATGLDDRHFLVTDEAVAVDRDNPGFTVRIPDVL